MESTEYLEELLRQFNVGRGAPISEVLEKYLEKTLQIKFQRIIFAQEMLKEEFVRLHESFLKILKIYQAADRKLDMSVFSKDQLGKFFFNQGVYALCKDNYLQAGEKFQESYKINKRNMYLLIYMGIILTVRRNYYAAGKYFAEATQRDPNYDEGWFYMAENYFKAGNFPKAMEYYEITKKLNPAFNNINLRIKETREAMAARHRGKRKDSLLKRIVRYIRDAFER
ncbi:MAG: tetratricopeptide repeat protein [Candidatus Aminicenantes bacterium]|nr:tetratricopeptide repeat protein [Candidatus Aminicenantes bacterium]